MPEQYFRDWLKVAAEEAYHFTLLSDHLKTLGYAYGDFPAHNGLWDMVSKNKDLHTHLTIGKYYLCAQPFSPANAPKSSTRWSRIRLGQRLFILPRQSGLDCTGKPSALSGHR